MKLQVNEISMSSYKELAMFSPYYPVAYCHTIVYCLTTKSVV